VSKEMKFIYSCFILLSFVSAFAEERPAKPNFVFFLIDDLGWQDIAAYDIDEPEQVQTPHIDKLAESGVLFWQGYSPSPTCTPSRAAIVSGMHPARSQCTHINGGGLPKVDSQNQSALITPWYSGRINMDQPSIATAMRRAGYATGHTGKWHNSANLFSFPTPLDAGFDFSTHDEGYMKKKYNSTEKGIQTMIGDKFAKVKKRPLRYSTSDSAYPLDKNGFPIDPIQVETIDFIKKNKDKPFFLYNATWLVHAPIQSRSEALVKKYYQLYLDDLEEKNKERTAKGEKPVKPEPIDDIRWSERGWNPYYHAMVETLDDQIGQTISYLQKTDDPRWKGHKLIDNTYLIFTSDNGGVISARAEQITDNHPLTKGKKYTREGGTRVPFIFAGPEIPAGVQSEVMINGLDIYPTVLSLAGALYPNDAILDGLNLVPLLKGDPTDPNLVKKSDQTSRKEMFWHFPHTTQCTATMRDAEYKAILNFGAEYIPKLETLELYRLYQENGERADLAESKPIKDPVLIKKYQQKIEDYLNHYGATIPHYNSKSKAFPSELTSKVPIITEHSMKKGKVIRDDGTIEPDQVTIDYAENGAKVEKAYLLYLVSHPEGKPEWLRKEVSIDSEKKQITTDLPSKSIGAVINIIDENNFMVSETLLKQKKPAK